MSNWQYNFGDGSAIGILIKEFKEAKKEVTTLQFTFQDKERGRMALEVPLYDRKKDLDLVPKLIDALKSFVIDEEQEEKQTVKIIVDESIKKEKSKPKFAEKICTKCGRDFIPTSPAAKKCNICRLSKKALSKMQEKLDKEADELGETDNEN